MAILYHFPIFHSLSSPKLSSSFHIPSPYSRLCRHHNYRCSTISASSSNKPPRGIKKLKSDEDLRNDIKNFLSSVGLPENHLPTMKELSHHGRQDLANIVRRRGYKFIKQLLETPSTANFIELNVDTGQTGSKEEDINSCIEADEVLQINDLSCAALTDESLSMQEKVARFIQLGNLDEAEDDALGMTNEEYADEEGKITKLEHSNEPGFAFSTSNGNVRSSAVKVDNPALESTISRNSSISTEEHTNTRGEGMDDEKQKVENQTDITHLKLLLYQKELELTQLKAEIEKEKRTI